MRPGNAIVFAQVALGLVPEVLGHVDMVFLVGEQKGMVDPVVLEPGRIQRVVTIPAVGIDDAFGSDFFLNNRHQFCRRRIGDNLRVNLATTPSKCRRQRLFLGAVSAPSFSLSAEIALVQFDSAIEGFVGCLKGNPLGNLLHSRLYALLRFLSSPLFNTT